MIPIDDDFDPALLAQLSRDLELTQARLACALTNLDNLARVLERIGGYLHMGDQHVLADAKFQLESEGRRKVTRMEWVDRG